MGIYLGQLPPAEVARLKAELAETLIAHFCYPRFFDNRTNELRMRPVDRAKRQEVWLFLSSVDFTSWSRVDLMSPDFQHQIERLFIQFVQRNRAFFGEQGRKRMSDVRMLINSSASSVVLGLRNHLTGQRQGTQTFGSPRPAISWSQSIIANRSEPNWEQIASTTMQLQQQLQDLRGETRPGTALGEVRPSGSSARRSQRPQITAGTTGMTQADEIATMQTPVSVPVTNLSTPGAKRPAIVNPTTPVTPARKVDSPTTSPLVPAEAATISSLSSQADPLNGSLPPVPVMKSGPLPSSVPTMKSGPLPSPVPTMKSGPLPSPVPTMKSGPLGSSPTNMGSTLAPAPVKTNGSAMGSETMQSTLSPAAPAQARSMSTATQPTSPTVASGARDTNIMAVGEDDVAIFEQMRHQLVVWLRIEAIRAGLEVSNQTPAQLLEMLRQQARFDETRLQVVSTLLNISNQIIKTGVVSLLDYKQALMFHLMHTRH